MSKITHRVKLIQEQLNVCFLDILPLKKGRSAITLHIESYLPQWMSFFLCIDIIIFRGRILWNSMEDGMSWLYLNSTLSFSDFESPLAFPMTSTLPMSNLSPNMLHSQPSNELDQENQVETLL